MKSKILCLAIIIAVVCSVFVISASASSTYDVPSDLTGTIWLVNAGWLSDAGYGQYNVTGSLVDGTYPDGVSFNKLYVGYNTASSTRADTCWFGGSSLNYSKSNSYSAMTISFTGGSDVSNPSLISWLMSYGIWQNAPVISTGVLSAGSYQVNGDFPDISAFSWINSGDFVYFDANGYIIQDFTTGTRFSQIGITYTEVAANAYVLQLSALVDTSSGQAFQPFVTFTYSPNGNIIHWHTDNFPNAYGIYFDYDVVVPTDILNIFLVFFDEFEQVYTGNVWYDIIDNVVEALKVDVFGYFSPWDILTTFIGLAIFLWLLKALAGG